jgi:hypothetical protein
MLFKETGKADIYVPLILTPFFSEFTEGEKTCGYFMQYSAVA